MVLTCQDRPPEMWRDFFQLPPVIEGPLVVAYGQPIFEPCPSRSGRKGWIEEPKKENLRYCEENKEKEKFQENATSTPYLLPDGVLLFAP